MKLDVLNRGKYLEGIFAYQNFLISLYKDAGMLKQPPVELENREDQAFMKTLFSDLIEELIEANIEYEGILQLYMESGHALQQNAVMEQSAIKKMKELIDNYNMEIADCVAFMVEIMIYSNVSASDIGDWYNSEREMELAEPLMMGNNHAFNLNWTEELFTARAESFEFKGSPDFGGRFISIDNYSVMINLSYDFIKKLKLAATFLKNKYWHNQDTPVQTENYQKALMEAWEAFMRYTNYTGISPMNLYGFYERKNQINQKRLTSGDY